MVSGTPVLTTPLPGMPEEYDQYVYLFDDESTEGMHQTLKLLLRPDGPASIENMKFDMKEIVLCLLDKKLIYNIFIMLSS